MKFPTGLSFAPNRICILRDTGRRAGAAALIALLFQGAAGAQEALPPSEEYRSRLSTDPGIVDVANSSESPLQWQTQDRLTRFRSAFESGICPRYEGWRTASISAPGQPFALHLALKGPVPVGTVIAYGNAPFQIQYPSAEGMLMQGDEGQALRVASFSAGVQNVAGLTFSATQVPGKFQNNFVLHRGNEAIDQKLASYALHLGGVYLFPEALENLAPYATVAVDGIGEFKQAERDLIAADGLNDRLPDRFWRSRKLAGGEAAEAVLTWPQPVTAAVVGCLNAMISFGDMPERAEFFVSASKPGEAPNWQAIGTISPFHNDPGSGRRLHLFRLAAPQTFTTMKVKFYSTRGRVAVSEILVLGEIAGERQSVALAKSQAAKEEPPIRVPYQLPNTPEMGARFTLVIEDLQGRRIRNLVADEPVTAQKGDVPWDGLDEDGRLVAPGSFVVRGLMHGPIRAEYLLSPYAPPGPVPWVTKDRRGGWLSDHCGATSVEFLGDKLWIGAPNAEAGDTIIRTDADGLKEWGLRWLDLDGARHMTSANGKIYVGNCSGWRGKNYSVIEVDPATSRFKRILDLREEVAANKAAPQRAAFWGDESFSGLAVGADRIYLTFRDQNRVDVYGLADAKKSGELSVPSPRGMFLESPESALILSGASVQRCDLRTGALAPVVSSGLADPVNLTVDKAGNILVADRGAHQVIVFSPTGKKLKTIGAAGGRKPGAYDPLALGVPMDVAVDASGRIWVAEASNQPKRVSVWNPDGTLRREFLGTGRYACGGFLDPADKTRFFAEGMEFALDYDNGTSALKSIVGQAPENSFFADAELRADRTLRAKGNLFLLSDRHWARPLFWFGVMRGDRLMPVAAVGRYEWAAKFFGKAHSDVPAGKEKEFTFLWQDENGDGEPQWEELDLRPGAFEGLHWALRMGDDLSFHWVENGKTLLRLAPASWTEAGEPRYDFASAQVMLQDDFNRRDSGLIAVAPLGKDRLLLNRKPLQCVDTATGKTLWTYRNDWPSNGHDSPLPVSGQLQHTLNIEGIVDMGGDVGEIFSLNSNKGFRHLMTVDGLYIGPVFRDTRLAPGLAIPEVAAGQDLAGFSLVDEAFLGSFQRAADGTVTMSAGKSHHSLYRIAGLEGIQRFQGSFEVSAQQVSAAEAYGLAREERQRSAMLSASEAIIPQTKTAPLEKLAWPTAPALAVQQQNKPLFEARMLHDKETLFLSVRVWDTSPFVNGGDDPKMLFKSGDSINLELGAARTSLKDPNPMPGDIRVLIAPYQGKNVVVIYRYKVAGTDKPVAFRSPAREVLVDRVDVLDNLPVIMKPAPGGYTLSVALPKAALGVPPNFSGTLFGDVGVVLSDPSGTVNSYVCFWASPAKGITADVPGEIMLRPQYWKPLNFKNP